MRVRYKNVLGLMLVMAILLTFTATLLLDTMIYEKKSVGVDRISLMMDYGAYDDVLQYHIMEWEHRSPNLFYKKICASADSAVNELTKAIKNDPRRTN